MCNKNNDLKEKIEELVKLGEFESAKEIGYKYMELFSEDIEIYSILAVANISCNEFLEAKEIIIKGLKLKSNDFDLNYNLGYVYERLKEDIKSIIHYKIAFYNCDDKEVRASLRGYIDNIEYKECLDKISDIQKYREEVKKYAAYQIMNPNVNVDVNDFVKTKKPIENLKPKIIYGTMEIANNLRLFSNELRSREYQSLVVNYYPSYLKYGADVTYNCIGKKVDEIKKELLDIVCEFIAEFDIFHFSFNTSFVGDFSELKVLKNLGKKIVMHYWGSDIRTYEKAIKMSEFYKQDEIKQFYFNEEREKNNHMTLKYVSRYADVACSFQLDEFIENYFDNIRTIPTVIDLKQFAIVKKQEKQNITIVHAPTNRVFKGSKYIIDAIEKLKQKYEFDFVLVEGLSHKEAKKIYEKADLIIDQIIAGGPGIFALECMAMGKSVVCYVSDYFYNRYNDYYGQENLLISASPLNVYEKIEDFIINSKEYKGKAEIGRKFVERNNDVISVVDELLEMYKSL